jgi:transketolase
MNEKNNLYKELGEKALDIRRNIVSMIYMASSGHPGGALSIVDILTVLYFLEMKISPIDPNDENRDRFVLSKGHASAALYATLAERGFINKEDLQSFRSFGSLLQGHPDMKKFPGIDMTTGSLGQGLSAANGMALAGKLDKKDYRVYCMIGDGELEEGQVWEAAMSSAHYKLDNLCVIVDNNNLQIDGVISEVMNSNPIDKKFKEFGFEVLKVNGHNYKALINAFEEAKRIKGKPTAIIAKTVKGKGVSYMENEAGWHGKAPSEEEYTLAMKDLVKKTNERSMS